MNKPPISTSTNSLNDWIVRLMTTTVWISATVFGAYILAFFAGAFITGDTARWNESLPNLFNPENTVANLAIGAHFLTGGLILIIGPMQLFAWVRQRLPALHRITGRLYVLTTFTTGLAGLVFILTEGTIGGLAMNIGFGLYGALMVLASIETFRHARARRIQQHRAWGLRLFALAIGSWLYRMEYGFWFLVIGEVGHTSTFDGPFDTAMAFLFYLPNLVIVEILLRYRHHQVSPVILWGANILFIGVSAFVALATYEMTVRSWGPAIMASFG